MCDVEVLCILTGALLIATPDTDELRILRVLKGRCEPTLSVMAEPKNAVADHSTYPKVMSLYLR
jgi:hypothetical protein